MRALIFSDDIFTIASIKLALAQEGIGYDTIDLAEDGLQMARLYDYDIILIELTSLHIDGPKILQRLRAAHVDTPILILSDPNKPDQRVKLLRFGADDILIKPFDGGELLARIQAIVRRSNGHSQSVIRTGKLVVNLDTRIASVDDQPINLTNRQYAVLELLSLRKGTTVTRQTFLNRLYGGVDEPELKTMDVFICKLRKKLTRATGGSHYIEAVWGRGYVLRDPVSSSHSAMAKPSWESAAARQGADGRKAFPDPIGSE